MVPWISIEARLYLAVMRVALLNCISWLPRTSMYIGWVVRAINEWLLACGDTYLYNPPPHLILAYRGNNHFAYCIFFRLCATSGLAHLVRDIVKCSQTHVRIVIPVFCLLQGYYLGGFHWEIICYHFSSGNFCLFFLFLTFLLIILLQVTVMVMPNDFGIWCWCACLWQEYYSLLNPNWSIGTTCGETWGDGLSVDMDSRNPNHF